MHVVLVPAALLAAAALCAALAARGYCRRAELAHDRAAVIYATLADQERAARAAAEPVILPFPRQPRRHGPQLHRPSESPAG